MTQAELAARFEALMAKLTGQTAQTAQRAYRAWEHGLLDTDGFARLLAELLAAANHRARLVAGVFATAAVAATVGLPPSRLPETRESAPVVAAPAPVESRVRVNPARPAPAGSAPTERPLTTRPERTPRPEPRRAPLVAVSEPAEVERLTEAAHTIAEGLDTEADVEMQIDRIAHNEPVAAAQEWVVVNYDHLGIKGYRRQTDADPCELCVWLVKAHLDPEGIGYIYPTTKPMHRHIGCVCTPVPAEKKAKAAA